MSVMPSIWVIVGRLPLLYKLRIYWHFLVLIWKEIRLWKAVVSTFRQFRPSGSFPKKSLSSSPQMEPNIICIIATSQLVRSRNAVKIRLSLTRKWTSKYSKKLTSLEILTNNKSPQFVCFTSQSSTKTIRNERNAWTNSCLPLNKILRFSESKSSTET